MGKLVAVGLDQIREDLPEFGPGDTVSVHVKVREAIKREYRFFKVL